MVAIIPSLADYETWVKNYMGIPVSALPLSLPVLSDSFNFALSFVNTDLGVAGGIVYTIAVYNFAGHYLVLWAPDQVGSYFPSPPADPQGTANNLGYFYWLRSPSGFNLNSFLPGVIRQSNDVSTGQALVVPKPLEYLTIQDLTMTRTPWGRTYLEIAQQTGTDWGLT